jgi:hypothetical protein
VNRARCIHARFRPQQRGAQESYGSDNTHAMHGDPLETVAFAVETIATARACLYAVELQR